MMTIRFTLATLALLSAPAVSALAESVEVEAVKDNTIYSTKPDETVSSNHWSSSDGPLVLEVYKRDGKPGNPDAKPPIAPEPDNFAMAYAAFDVSAYKGRITSAKLAVCDARTSRDGGISVALLGVAGDWGETADQAMPLTWNTAIDYGRNITGDGYGFDPAVIKWQGGLMLDKPDISQVIAVPARNSSDSQMLYQLNNDEDGLVVFGFFSRYGTSYPIIAREDPDYAGPTLLLEVEEPAANP